MTTFQIIRRKKKLIAHGLNTLLLFGIVIQANTVLALTGGPSQPEVQSFQPAGMDNLVDPFTGDFSYSIPLMDIDGYPLNLSYSSNIGMEDEASWVGLGWNLSPGVVNRTVRGIPDDFDGDIITKEMNVKKNTTLGITGEVGKEFIGIIKRKGPKADLPYTMEASLSVGINYNSYNGVNAEINTGFSATVNPALGNKNKMEDKFSLDITNSSSGLDVQPSYSLPTKGGQVFSLGTSYNSHSGLNSMQLGLQNVVQDLGISASIPFGMQSYTPTIEMPMNLVSVSLGVKGGHEVKFTDKTGKLDGYYSQQKLAQKTRKIPALGFLNSQNCYQYDNGYGINAMMDVNRENDGSFNPNTPLLPAAYMMYDMFNVTTQGVSGNFRAFRNDVGFCTDPYVNSHSNGGHGNLDFNIGDLSKAGIDVGVNYVENVSGYWNSDRAFKSAMDYFPSAYKPYQDFEPYYFKKIGEATFDTEADFRSNYGDEKATRVKLNGSGFNVYSSAELVDASGNVQSVSRSKAYRKKKMPKGILFKTVKRSEMDAEGLQDFSDIMHPAPDHHIAEVVTVTEGGAEYHFGLPAYNTYKEECTFNVGEKTSAIMNAKLDPITGFVDYHEQDNSKDNEKGSDNYFSRTITPGYAHSYLLTAIVSGDYVDADLIKGPSDNDLGTYTKFDYKKLDNPFKWRTPYDEYKANHNAGMRSDPSDDKGLVSYGEKEIWYLEKIETKNLVAVFTTEAREDGYEVADRNGGIGEQSMHRLTKISLYAKRDYVVNQAAATPIKEVHFVYDYSLCNGIPNNINGGGKLTLKKVYFTYGTSLKGQYNAYEFTYDQNPNYQGNGNDKWGTYKPNTATPLGVHDPDKNNMEFPHTDQDKTVTDVYVAAWALSQIKMPNSGTIDVHYESDDYAYVQNQRAMELFEVAGVVDDNPQNLTSQEISDAISGSTGKLFEYTVPLISRKDNVYLLFKLKDDIPMGPLVDAEEEFKDKYLRGIDDVFFKFMVNIKDAYNPYYENVEGFAEMGTIDVTSGLISHSSSDYDYGYIKLNKVDIGDREGSEDIHPIAKAAWQYGRMYMSKYLNENFDPESSGLENNIKKLVSTNIFKNLYATIVGPNRIYMEQNFGQTFIKNRSYVRLNEPRRIKLGGGSRVKELIMSDNWSNMVTQPGNTTSYYGKSFTYTTVDPETNETISSGVAASEPSVGGEESPLVMPVYSKNVKKKVLAPDDRFYLTTPIGKAIFPSPTVGYSKVTIKDLVIGNPNGTSVTRHAKGKMEKEFYTARDFPVIVEVTDLDLELSRNIPKGGIFVSYSRDYATASQGFSIQLNNMHGKPKASWVYEEGKDEPISGSQYTYKTENYGEDSYKLINDAAILSKDGKVSQGQLGVETDIAVDFRQYFAGSGNASAQANLESTTAGAVPLILGTVWPNLSIDETRFRSVTMTKIVSRYGILEKVTAFDLGSSIATENRAYDSETGSVLLTKTKNEFEDNIYNLILPAYWYYDLMGPSYLSDNIKTENISINASGYATITNADKRYVLGDEVVLSDGTHGWITEISQNQVKIVSILGSPFEPTYPATTIDTDIKTVQSGRKNMQRATMASFSLKDDPMYTYGNNQYESVIGASVQLFREGWKTYCDCFTNSELLKNSTNEYVTAQKGIFRAFKSLTYLTDRTQSVKNNNTDIRVDGEFASFSSYWVFNDWGIGVNEDNWTWAQEATEYGPTGIRLESMDALERYSSAVYGYNHALPIGMAKNSQYREIGFDNFEDYDYSSCDDDHFSYKTYGPHEGDAHTGSHSMHVEAGGERVITKDLEECN